MNTMRFDISTACQTRSDHASAAAPSCAGDSAPFSRVVPRSAFTLIEMLVTVAVVSVALSFSAFAFNKATEANILAQAKNAVLTYAKLARSYAIANQIETMLVVNPYNGRFEIWHLNPPSGGGPFDVFSSGSPPAPVTGPTNMDSYAFAPVLDSGARLPFDRNGRPLAIVNPIDFDDDLRRPFSGDTDQQLDNLTWAAFCFNRSGELVIRTRRIATRSYTLRDGSLRPASQRNRLIDETPDLAIFMDPSLSATDRFLVFGGPTGDTPITSTRGFVISEGPKLRQVVPATTETSSRVVGLWLSEALPDELYADFASTVILNRYSGEELTGDR